MVRPLRPVEWDQHHETVGRQLRVPKTRGILLNTREKRPRQRHNAATFPSYGDRGTAWTLLQVVG